MAKQPLSPHLQIYKPQLTSMLSILHRGTGVFLMLGAAVLVYWLMTLAIGHNAYHSTQQILGSKLGQLMVFLWTWALFYHLCNGIRHLVWDTGRGLELPEVYRSGKLVLWLSLGLTLFSWIAVWP